MPSDFVGLVAQFLREHPALSAANLAVAMTLAPVGDVLLPHLYGKLVAAIEKSGKDSGSRRPQVQGKGKGADALLAPALHVLAVLALWQAGSVGRDLLDMQTLPRLVDFVRSSMLAAVIRGHDGDLAEQLRVGELGSKLVRAPDLVSWWSQAVLNYLLPYLATLVWVGAYFWWHDAWLAVGLLAFVATCCMLLILSPSRCVGAAIRREEALQEVHERSDDVLRNLVSVYGGGATVDAELAGVGDRGEAYRRANAGAMLCMIKYKAIGVPLIVGFVAAVVLRCVHLVRAGRMKVGTFVSIFMMATASVGTLSWLVSLIKDSTLDVGTLTHAQDMFFFGQAPGVPAVAGIPPPNGALEPPNAGGPSIAVVDVTLLRLPSPSSPISLTVGAGEVVVLVGPVGSGKSTLLRLIAGLTRPATGDVYLDGASYRRLGLRFVRRKVGYMPQEAVLFDRTAGENILYGAPPGATAERAVALATALGLWDALAPGLPLGMDTRVGKGGSRLSGGQRQLVWFLRLAIRDTPVLVLDEPTASMDAGTRGALIGALAELVRAKKKTVVLATHDADLAASASRSIAISDGRFPT